MRPEAAKIAERLEHLRDLFYTIKFAPKEMITRYAYLNLIQHERPEYCWSAYHELIGKAIRSVFNVIETLTVRGSNEFYEIFKLGTSDRLYKRMINIANSLLANLVILNDNHNLAVFYSLAPSVKDSNINELTKIYSAIIMLRHDENAAKEKFKNSELYPIINFIINARKNPVRSIKSLMSLKDKYLSYLFKEFEIKDIYFLLAECMSNHILELKLRLDNLGENELYDDRILEEVITAIEDKDSKRRREAFTELSEKIKHQRADEEDLAQAIKALHAQPHGEIYALPLARALLPRLVFSEKAEIFNNILDIIKQRYPKTALFYQAAFEVLRDRGYEPSDHFNLFTKNVLKVLKSGLSWFDQAISEWNLQEIYDPTSREAMMVLLEYYLRHGHRKELYDRARELNGLSMLRIRTLFDQDLKLENEFTKFKNLIDTAVSR